MTVEEFRASLLRDTAPEGLSAASLALWHDGRGDWARAHDVAQDINAAIGSHIHAYLHRKEGDISNAHYWYRRAGLALASGSLDDEWLQLVKMVMGK